MTAEVALAIETQGVEHKLPDRDFALFQALLHRTTGINLSTNKKALVCGRLAKRLKHHGLDSFHEYYDLITSHQDRGELQIAIDLLTTNETYFFREPKHFDYLRHEILPSRQAGQSFRVWSAACSSGEEPYSIAMLLSDTLQQAPWEIVASDISTRILNRARSAHYAMERADHIPEPFLRKFCLKGIGSQEGTFLIDRSLRSKIQFLQVNLNAQLPGSLGEFDVIFLRNVMIYFNQDTKRQLVQRLSSLLKPGGHLLIGHSESLNGICENLIATAPSVYRKP